jgi:hypothetical protein
VIKVKLTYLNKEILNLNLKNIIFLIFYEYSDTKEIFLENYEDETGQAGAEMILLIGGMIVIVLVAIHFYKDYLLGLQEEMNSTELAKLNQSIKNISSKFS